MQEVRHYPEEAQPGRGPRGAVRAGFTLIELLVVVAVIAVLAAILFPVFSQARESARQATCMANERQLWFGIEMYKSDWESKYPVSRSSSEEAPVAPKELYANWSTLIYPYVKHGIAKTTGYPVKVYSGIFRCPDDSGVPSVPPAPFTVPLPPMVGPSYALNAWFLGGLEEARVASPADTVLIAEKRGSIPIEHFLWWKDPWPAWPMQAGATVSGKEDAINTIGAAENEVPVVTVELEEIYQEKEAAGLATRRHHGGANYLFADGHARWSRLDRIWGNGASTNLFWPARPEATVSQ